MQLKTYIIEYIAYNNDNAVLKRGKVRAKNKLSAIDAQVKFEAYLKNKYCDFGRLVVYDCREDDVFNDIFDLLNL